MVTRYTLVNWQFNVGAWCQAMNEACDEHGCELVAQYLDVHYTTVINWRRGRTHEAFPYPNMTNFLKFCNTFDRDARDFFEIVDAQ